MENELYTRCSFGAYADNTAGHEALENRVGAKLQRYVTFQDLPSVGGGDGWPQTDADWCARTGHDLVIAWDIHSNINLSGDQLLRGDIDKQLDSFFLKAKAFPNKVVLRMWWEFNDGRGRKVGKNRTAWPGGYGQWRDGWRYVVNRAKANGAHVSQGGNVSFFWCANGSDNRGLRMEEFWPGPEYVDMIGLDTYNDHRELWTEFADKIQPMMDRILKLPGASGKPLGIGETGSLDSNNGKANWYRNLFLTTRWPDLKVVDFFSTKKEADWRIDYPESLRLVSAEFLPKSPPDAWSGTTTTALPTSILLAQAVGSLGHLLALRRNGPHSAAIKTYRHPKHPLSPRRLPA
ncbi:hypothetical protein M1D93_14755 [Arthrobacter sp. Z1-9]